MPEQNSQNPVVFNPSTFELSAPEQPAVTYTVRADAGLDAGHVELSCYVQNLFQSPRGVKRPGGNFSDQPPPVTRSAQEFRLAMQNQYQYSPAGQLHQGGHMTAAGPQSVQQSFAPPQSVNPPGFAPTQSVNPPGFAPTQSVNPPGFAPTQSGSTMNFSDQVSDVTSGQAPNNFVPQEARSFAPPADRSSLPYVPPAQRQKYRGIEKQDSVDYVPSSNGADTGASNMVLVGQSLGGVRPSQTKMVDLRQQKAAEKPSPDRNTVAEPPEFLNRESFSNKFTEASVESTENDAAAASDQQALAPSKIIYLRSVEPKPQQPAAKLVEPTFEPEPIQPFAPKISEASSGDIAGDSPFAPIESFQKEQAPLAIIEEIPNADKPVETEIVAVVEEVTEVEPPQMVEPPVEAIAATPSPFAEVSPASESSSRENLETQAQAQALTKAEPQGFRDSDFSPFEQTQSHFIAEAPVQRSPFRIASHRRSTTEQQLVLPQTTQEAITNRVVPRLQMKQYKLAGVAREEQLTTAVGWRQGQNQQSQSTAEMGWLSPWWMLVGLIPLAMYVAATRIFSDDDYELEEEFEGPVRFESDFGIPGRSKSDAIYGDDDDGNEILEILENRYLQLDEEFKMSRASIPFAEPLFCDLPVENSAVSEIAGASAAPELSAENSPNFSSKGNARQKNGANKSKAQRDKRRKKNRRRAS